MRIGRALGYSAAFLGLVIGCVNVVPPPKPEPIDVTPSAEASASASSSAEVTMTMNVLTLEPTPSATASDSRGLSATDVASASAAPTATATAAPAPTATAPVATATSAPPPIASSMLGPATLDGERIVTTAPIHYATGKADLLPSSEAALFQVKELLAARIDLTLVRIEVHTDSMGNDDANLALSKARALSVARELVKLGVSCQRLVATGFGETKPIAPNDTADGRAKNRRTELIVAALRKKPVGGKPVDGGGVVAGDPCK